MPGLSGSQVAYRLALADVARADTTRAGYFLRNVVPVWIGGAARSGVVQSSIRIDLNTGAEPHRCSFSFKGGGGYIPQAGHSVVIGHGTTASPLFSGRILSAPRTAARIDDRRPVYDCDAVGHVFELNTARVVIGFTAQSLAPYSLVPAVLAVTSPSASAMGFTASVDPTLPIIARFDVGPADDLAKRLDEVFREARATWHVDHGRTVRATAASSAAVATLTAPSLWGLRYTPTDLSRVYTRAHVVGARHRTLADFVPSAHATVPVESASLLSNGVVSTSGGVALTSTEKFLFGHTPMDGLAYQPEFTLRAGQASVFLPSSRFTNVLTVVAANVSSVSPLDAQRWYRVAGQYLYVSSRIGVYSATASSIAYSYFVPSSVAGAIETDILQTADIAPLWNFEPGSASLSGVTIPVGTDVALYVSRNGLSNVNEVSSLFGSTTYGLISKTFDDPALTIDGAVAVASAALERGTAANWSGLEFETRNEQIAIGRPLYVSIASTAEPSGASIAGTFIAHDVSIGEFGRLTETRGPVRRVTAGAVRKSTLWNILQGDR